MKRLVQIVLILLVHIIFAQNDFTTNAKFEPENGQVLLFIGQDLEAIGRLENYSGGYSDFFDMPRWNNNLYKSIPR